jgi:hypothetical protein
LLQSIQFVFYTNCIITEAHRLRVFRRTFKPKRDEVTGDWRKLYNEELHNLYSSPSIIRVIKSRKDEMGGACSMNGEGECL